MTEFKPIKNLDELKNVQVGEIIGVGQLNPHAIPALCKVNDGERMRLLGYFTEIGIKPPKNKVIVEYNFLIDDIKGFRADGSLIFKKDENSRKYFGDKDEGYEPRKQILIEGGIWN